VARQAGATGRNNPDNGGGVARWIATRETVLGGNPGGLGSAIFIHMYFKPRRHGYTGR
jgi:hypothetical protein